MIACALLLYMTSSNETTDTTSIMSFKWDSCFAYDVLTIKEVQILEQARLRHFKSIQKEYPLFEYCKGFWTRAMKNWMLENYDSLTLVP